MNIDRLIDRIEKALREEATTDPVFHALAKEYAKYRTQIDERLEHCVTLTRSGKDFAARELAEQPPDVLVLMEKLSFGNDAKWKELCEEKGLYLGPNWSDDHVDLLNGLYDKEISEDSPLFREYRAAARSRDEDKTFKILKMILKANPDHAAAVYEKFYFIGGVTPTLLLGIALAELALLLAFVAGIAKTYTYGAVLLLHAVSTLSSYQQYLNPFEGPNLLFFAAWPMLAACLALFWLRAEDRLLARG